LQGRIGEGKKIEAERNSRKRRSTLGNNFCLAERTLPGYDKSPNKLMERKKTIKGLNQASKGFGRGVEKRPHEPGRPKGRGCRLNKKKGVGENFRGSEN